MQQRKELLDADIIKAIALVSAKIDARLLVKHRGSYIGNHETYGILAEEFKELLDALQSDNSVEFGRELTDIAVGAILGMASIFVNERTITQQDSNSITAEEILTS